MSEGTSRFERPPAAPSTPTPDTAVTAPRGWALCAVIIACTAALLGTSETPPSSSSETSPMERSTTYRFERTGIDGGFVELTRDRPTATFFVTVHGDALAPDGAITTDGAAVSIDGTVTSSGLADGAVPPLVSVKLSVPDVTGFAEKLVQDSYTQLENLIFRGDCATPSRTGSCRARFALEVTRKDDGASDGVVRFDWLFDVTANFQRPSKEDGMVGPLDPPWTIEVSQP